MRALESRRQEITQRLGHTQTWQAQLIAHIQDPKTTAFLLLLEFGNKSSESAKFFRHGVHLLSHTAEQASQVQFSSWDLGRL